MIATILGHLLRCLYYRQGHCNPEGFCKASWIANIFGVSHRNIKAARRHLEQIGLLQRTEVPQWVRNRYGQKMTINLQWNPPTPVPAQVDSSVLPPLARPTTAELPPPDSYEKLPSGAKHQKPATSGTAGALLALFTQAREAVRNGTVPSEEPEPVVTPRFAPLPQQASQPSSEKRSVSLSTPSLQKIIPEDLRDTPRLLSLYDQAVQTHVIGASEADRLAFVGLAEHVLGYEPENPGALFRQLLVHRRFAFITQTEEDAARRRLTHHLYNEKWATPLQATG
jgi:hypothetical protein